MTGFCCNINKFVLNLFKLKKHSVQNVVDLSVYPARIVGVFPFKNDGTKFVLSKIFFSFSCLICFVWLSILFYFLFLSLDVPRQSYLSRAANYIGVLLFTVIPICGLWETTHYIRVFNGCVRSFREVELLLSTKGQPLKYSVSMMYFYLECALLICVLISGILDNHLSPVNFWVASLQTVFNSAVYVQIMAFLHRLTVCLGLVTTLLKLCSKELGTLPKQPHLPVPLPMDRAYRAELLIKAYDKLCDSAESLNDIQQCHVVMTILAGYMWCVVEAYELYAIGLCWDYKRNLFTVIMKCSWSGVFICVIWQIVSSCAEYTKKAKEFNNLLYQLMIDDRTNEISNNKKLRLHISMKREVVFSACGFFTLDYTLVHSMIAAATTYLVILIQFGQHSTNQSISQNNTSEKP